MYYRLPFATSGTTTSIPDTQPGNGAVNWTTGYSNVYQLDPDTDPLALRVERAQMNFILNTITATLKQIYEHGIPPFIESSENGGSAYSYSKDALVKRSGVVYSSNVNSNTSAPPGANWTVVDMAVFNAKAPTNSPTFTGTPIAPTAAASTNSTQLATTAFVRSAMALFGIGTAGAVRATNANTILDGGMYYSVDVDSGYPTAHWYSLLHVPYGDGSGMFQIAVRLGTALVYFRDKANNVWNSWQRIYHSGDSNPIISWGNNVNGYYRVHASGLVTINRTISHTGTVLVPFPVSIASTAGATGSVTPLVGSTPAPGPYGLSITTGGYGIYGPNATVTVEITLPFGV